MAWHGEYTRKIHNLTFILEVVTPALSWIWHCLLWLSSSLNDITVLQRSHIFVRISSGDAPACNYTTNGRAYTMGYFLDDGIYTLWSIFVKTIPNKETF
jgi:hypothetical protein